VRDVVEMLPLYEDPCCADRPNCCEDKAACCAALLDSGEGVKPNVQPSACACSV
jgi:hypothetical protein